MPSIQDNYRTLYEDFCYALEGVIYKEHDESSLSDAQTALDNTLCELEIMFPVYFAGTQTRKQLHFTKKTVSSAGPVSSSAMLDVEGYNVFVNKWAKSRKNVGEGWSRQNAMVAEVSVTVRYYAYYYDIPTY